MCFFLMGYVVLGIVLVIGILVFVFVLDYLINDIVKMMEWGCLGFVFFGSLFVIVFVLVVCFLVVVIGSIESSFSKVLFLLDMVVCIMGCYVN